MEPPYRIVITLVWGVMIFTYTQPPFHKETSHVIY